MHHFVTSLRTALTTWTTRNSLPSLRHSELEDLWTRSIQSHQTSLQNHITHKDSNDSLPTPFSTMRTGEPLPFESFARWSTTNASPKPSPIRWFSENWTTVPTTSSRIPSPRSTNSLARPIHGPLVLDVIFPMPTSSQNARNSSSRVDPS